MPRKGENIYKRKDGRWEGRYIKSRSGTGKAAYGYVYAKTYREVKAKLHEVTALSATNNITAPKDSDLFFSVAAEWFSTIKSQVKESTQNKYLNLLNSYILPAYGQQKLENITYDFIEKQCGYLLTTGGRSRVGLSPKTVADTLSLIRNILKFAIKKGKRIPCDGTGVQVKQYPTKMRVFTKTEQKTLSTYLNENLDSCNLGILICLFTGLRIGEVCALCWDDVSFSDRVININHTLQRVQDKTDSEKRTKIVVTTPKSTCSIRTIPLPDSLADILENYRTVSRGYVLTNSTSAFIEPRTMQNHFEKTLRNCSIEKTNFHTTRHTFATRCVELGFDIKSLSEILGHATVNITMNRYVHPTMELKRDNMQKLSSLFTVE